MGRNKDVQKTQITHNNVRWFQCVRGRSLLSLTVNGPQFRKSRVIVIVIVIDTNIYSVSGGTGQCLGLSNKLHAPDVASRLIVVQE